MLQVPSADKQFLSRWFSNYTAKKPDLDSTNFQIVNCQNQKNVFLSLDVGFLILKLTISAQECAKAEEKVMACRKAIAGIHYTYHRSHV